MTIEQILSQHYRIQNINLTEIQPGWSALAYRIDAAGKRYFLKVFDMSRHTSQIWIQAIDRYMPTLIWLNEYTPLQGRIPRVILTTEGKYKCEDSERLYILFEWINGITPCEEPLTRTQCLELAKIIAELHKYDTKIPTETSIIREKYDIPFFVNLLSLAKNGSKHIPREYSKTIIEKLELLSELSNTLSAQNLPYVLCHNDVHGWNVITDGDNLFLLDWEGLRLAPHESDLFVFKYGQYLSLHWDEFLDAYQTVHPDFEINETAMRFFQLRRRLDDINEFIASLIYDKTSDKVQADARRHIITECSLL